jgi:hypothetical protein
LAGFQVIIYGRFWVFTEGLCEENPPKEHAMKFAAMEDPFAVEIQDLYDAEQRLVNLGPPTENSRKYWSMLEKSPAADRRSHSKTITRKVHGNRGDQKNRSPISPPGSV